MPNATVYVDALDGIDIYLKPADDEFDPLVLSPWASDVITGTWDLPNLRWVFSVPNDANYVEYEQVGGSPVSTDLEVGVVVKTVEPGSGGDTTPGTTLITDFSGDWLWVDGVEDAGYQFGPQRQWRTTTPTAPSNGVKVRRGNPNKADMIAAAAMGVKLETTDIVLTVWSETLNDGGAVFDPQQADYVVLSDGRARIMTLTRTIDGAQWRCSCRFATE